MTQFPASPNDSVVVNGAVIVDASGNIWGITNGQVTEIKNPNEPDQTFTVDSGTANVDALAYVDGVIWQQATAQGLWWAKTGTGFDGWGTATSVSPLPPSPDGTVITMGNTPVPPSVHPINGSAIVDSSGNLWWISDGEQVIENGQVDADTANVIEIAFKNGLVWQENTDKLWWAKTGGAGSFDGWSSGPGTHNANGTLTAPVPIDRTWLGGGNDRASNPNDWSPKGSPQPGDALSMPNGGTMNIHGNDLHGDTLLIGGASSSPSQDFTLNVSGTTAFQEAAAFPPVGIGSITINLADHAKWIGGFSTNLGGGVFITGEGRFANQVSNVAAKSTVDVDVVGHGTFNVESDQSVVGVLEFTKSVDRGQAITVGGDQTRGVTARLLVDDPRDFHAPVKLGFGEIVLGGLKADSFTVKDDLLLLFSGSKVVGKLDLTVQPQAHPTGFTVSQSSQGITLFGDGAGSIAGGTLLPMHT
jgi:hypothetical protein